VDLHWSHPHPTLRQTPSDVYFGIRWHAIGEATTTFCSDEVGQATRSCGTPLNSVAAALPSSFATICGLRPNRTINFIVEALNCDLQSSSAHFQALTPSGAPDVVLTKVTVPPAQESFAGFHPMALLDWIPVEGLQVEGHAIYLGLAGVSAAKLLCWVPHGNPGHLELPIEHKNHTHSKHALLIRDSWNGHHVHQEQELLISTRTAVFDRGRKTGYLESPTRGFRLGNWLVMEDSVKCLNAFESRFPEYASQPVVPAWTQEEAQAMYD